MNTARSTQEEVPQEEMASTTEDSTRWYGKCWKEENTESSNMVTDDEPSILKKKITLKPLNYASTDSAPETSIKRRPSTGAFPEWYLRQDIKKQFRYSLNDRKKYATNYGNYSHYDESNLKSVFNIIMSSQIILPKGCSTNHMLFRSKNMFMTMGRNTIDLHCYFFFLIRDQLSEWEFVWGMSAKKKCHEVNKTNKHFVPSENVGL